IRPDEFAQVTEAVNFVADMERMGLVRRLRPGRLTPTETAELLARVLGGPVDGPSAAAMHAQSEGVPFIVEEIARAHRDAGTLQELDGRWRLGRNAARLLPAAVRTLIHRRSSRLPKRAQELLGDAGVLGRSFSLKDLRAVETRVESEPEPGTLADELRPAVEAGLLLPHPAGDAADFTFTHEQVRQFAIGQLSTVRRRQVHAAVVDLLTEGGEPAAEGLPMLAQHALAAGDTSRAARFSIEAASAALASNAPEEALRLVEAALPVVATPADRRTLLLTRDDAFAALRKTDDRLQGLTELAALAEAMRDSAMELDVQLRRASALRMAHDEDAAAELAKRVRTRAAERGDAAVELRATLEQGQALLRTPIGEGYGVATTEVDLEGGEEAYRHAVELAEQLGDDRSLAAALREVAMVDLTRSRDWFAGEVASGRVFEHMARLSAGETIDDLLPTFSIAPVIHEAVGLLERALSIYERLGDRTGQMSTVIGMAYVNYAPLIHLTSSARHLEEIRRVRSRLDEMVTESERARQELQMLYGVHVYARAKIVPDLAVQRGEEAHRAARIQGDRAIEFAAAGGVALSYLDLGDLAAAEKWLGLAATAAAAAPARARARQLEAWRGRVRGAAGNAEEMRRHFERAIAMATEDRKAAARCELIARLALEASRLGAAATPPDESLLEHAESSASQAKELALLLPGRAPWGAYADAALARVRLARGDTAGAAQAAGAVVQYITEAVREDVFPEILLPAARALLAGGPPDAQDFIRTYLRLTLSKVAQGTVDESIRVRWLRGPVGRELVELAGPMDALAPPAAAPAAANGHEPAPAAAAPFDDIERSLLGLLTQGQTNAEMAASLGLTEEEVSTRLARLLARLGASSRAEATSLAFRGLAPVGAR
ncbi:MAG TPA: LuxR C-terminal-related transcriptional regulator, partial [Candidatus Limnocylindrales bacterium]|nr:LuxR C-terminal-related transcriptional regulator [Candidatus Limnocylindrales bacterium]